MGRQRRSCVLLALMFGFSLVAACGDDDDDQAADDPGASDEVPEGGDLVVGAEQEPDCADWIASCGGSSWGLWMMGVNTMPRAFDIVRDDDQWVYRPSILLADEPQLETEPRQTVTYAISEEAVWSDGTPITCADFHYTWDQIAHADAIYDRTGYQDIESVECPDGDDGTSVVTTYATPYAGWRSLFGGSYGIYPAHLLEGRDRNAEMADGYPWSGGPWAIEEWVRGEHIRLVPNERYWGQVPRLDSVTFRFITETSAEFEAFRGGEVLSIFPQPQVDVIQQVEDGFEGAEVDVQADSASIEALWLNNAAFPFDSQAVRQAFAHALDRDAIVERLFGGLGITEAMQTFNAPILGDFVDPEAFSIYDQDLDRVEELMEGEGWTRDDDGIWQKDGRRAEIAFKTTTGNARRETTQDIVIEQARAAGFEVRADNGEAGDLFGQQIPGGDFQMALYAQTLSSLEPSLSNFFVSANIPSEANEFAGLNWTRSNIPEADPLLLETDANPDQEERSEAMAEADRLLAEAAASIPLDPMPNIGIWSEQIVGPKINNPVFGPYTNMEEWGLAG